MRQSFRGNDVSVNAFSPLPPCLQKNVYFRNISTNYIERILNDMGHLQSNKLLKPIKIIVKVLVIKLNFRAFY